MNVLFADGSVKFIKDSVNAGTWRALGTIAGGEVISADSY
ncbi:MAG: H-X9-DG-CTERM domain-containing protein [bacterium]